MYADDMVIFSDTSKGLQDMLNTLYCYTEKWKLCAHVLTFSYIDLITNKSLPQIPIFDNLYHKLSLSIVSNAFV
jgi:hypothetical protein